MSWNPWRDRREAREDRDEARQDLAAERGRTDELRQMLRGMDERNARLHYDNQAMRFRLGLDLPDWERELLDRQDEERRWDEPVSRPYIRDDANFGYRLDAT